jgi:hypothetical protein
MQDRADVLSRVYVQDSVVTVSSIVNSAASLVFQHTLEHTLKLIRAKFAFFD